MRHVDSFEIQPPTPPTAQRRTPVGLGPGARRVSRWHRPYTAILLAARLRRGRAGQLDRDRSSSTRPPSGFSGTEQDPTWFHTVAYLLLPLGWLLVLWGNGAYDRRYLGLGHRRVQAGRPGRRDGRRDASRSSPSPPRPTLSRLTVGTALVGALVLHPARPRIVARRVLHVHPRPAGQAAHRMLLVGTLPEALEVYTAVTRSPAAGLVPVGIHLTDGYAAARGIADPGAGVRRPRRAGPGPRGRRGHDRGLRLGQRRAGRAAPAGLAAGGHRRRPGGRAAADRHRRPPGAHPPGRGPAAAARRGADALRPGAGWSRT